MTEFKKAIDFIRDKSSNDVELGTAFEKLVKVFFENDATQKQEYSQIWHYTDWAKKHPTYTSRDTGIDLVAKLRDQEGYCAIQCKCYQSNHSISKADIDSFISAAATTDFKRLLLIDTSLQPIGNNAMSTLANLSQEYIRIQLKELEESLIDWSSYIKNNGEVKLRSKKILRDDQIYVLRKVREGFKTNDRGKIIMACGTGKTFTSLRITEDIAGEGKIVLYMVPSLALMSQTIREWKNDSLNDFIAFSACSDSKVGRRNSQNDLVEVSLNDLAFPACTDPENLSQKIKEADQSKLIVVFSTYQSIEVISKAQQKYGLRDFDLIICDEAHRTTGATLSGEDESKFIRIHKDENIKAKKRLYMTATPKIYGETAKKKEYQGEVNLASMDDEDLFGPTFIHRSFGWAVENNLLTDYKVVVLIIDEQVVSNRVQKNFLDGSTELNLDDVTKMVGCYKALAKIGINNNQNSDLEKNKPMKRALAFCQNINLSKTFASEFSSVVKEYIKNENIPSDSKKEINVELHHVDGTFNAEKRNEKLNWLMEETDEDICRVLSNARCLSEGVDVPALDAIMFLHPRKSQIDVVQSVGRVMRKAKGKDLGYVILPIAVAPGVSAERALSDNKRYQVIWQILNALRAHDERFDSTINRIGLGEDVSNRIEIIETTSVIEDIKNKSKERKEKKKPIGGDDPKNDKGGGDTATQLSFTLTDLSKGIKAKIVEKCGTRDYWEKWATDIGNIAQQHITRINSIVLNSNTPEREAFLKFVEEIRDDLNPEISETDAVEMLAQHIITKPVFETLFEGNRFTSDNAVSRAMETILSKIYAYNIKSESESLEKFYSSVKRRAADVISSSGKQALILELYDRFFRNAFPIMTQRLGIVYTPVQIVDFIISSVEDVMQEEFKTSLNDDDIHILDPFAGTGTFISRLIQSNIISKEQLKKKFKSEIHANEILLLAYYIACINIESVYDELIKEETYNSFNGFVLTDTFQLYEQERDMIANLLPDNSERRENQKKKNITVIIGNPPYSVGQTSANDNAANNFYRNLDQRIENTYASKSNSASKKDIYDSYIRAFRWASDRINDHGVIGFVSGSGWLEKGFARGIRESFAEEFSKIYVINTRGDIRKNMLNKGDKSEGENIFGAGCMTGICITLLVKNGKKGAEINYLDIGENLTTKEKLDLITEFKGIKNIKDKFIQIFPDDENDWINKGDKRFKEYICLGDRKNIDNSIFKSYSLGIATGRDVWCNNFSRDRVSKNCLSLINFYNSELDRYKKSNKKEKATSFVRIDRTKMSWNSNAFQDIERGKEYKFNSENIIECLYRPFTKTNLYFSKELNARTYQIPKFFPTNSSKNKLICISGIGSRNGFSVLMTDCVPDLNLMEAGAQSFPLKIFTSDDANQKDLFSSLNYLKEDFQYALNSDLFGIDNLSNETLNKLNEDLFYYIYAVLNSDEYKNTFANNLSKELPRIPIVKDKTKFKLFVNAGKELGSLHTNFEKVDKFPISLYQGKLGIPELSYSKSFYKVNKMKFKNKNEKSSVIYNENITIDNIPQEAYEYVINGKPAPEWVMERQCIKTDKTSGIVNDANDFANEARNNPAYPLELFQRVIFLSIKTRKIIRELPELEIKK